MIPKIREDRLLVQALGIVDSRGYACRLELRGEQFSVRYADGVLGIDVSVARTHLRHFTCIFE